MSYRRVVRSVSAATLSITAVVALQVGMSSEVWAATPNSTATGSSSNWDRVIAPTDSSNWDKTSAAPITNSSNWDKVAAAPITNSSNWDKVAAAPVTTSSNWDRVIASTPDSSNWDRTSAAGSSNWD